MESETLVVLEEGTEMIAAGCCSAAFMDLFFW